MLLKKFFSSKIYLYSFYQYMFNKIVGKKNYKRINYEFQYTLISFDN